MMDIKKGNKSKIWWIASKVNSIVITNPANTLDAIYQRTSNGNYLLALKPHGFKGKIEPESVSGIQFKQTVEKCVSEKWFFQFYQTRKLVDIVRR